MGAFDRIKPILGEDNLAVLARSHVAVFGVGGVGGFAAEALARSGVGKITVFDADTVSETNLNRQIIATRDSIGMDKVEEIRRRLVSINPELEIYCEKVFYLPENSKNYPLDIYDYVIDAVDTVTAKIEIIARSAEKGVPVISCMGTGGKTDPCLLKIGYIEDTSVCPLARVMRRELKKRNIFHVKAVYSEEKPSETYKNAETAEMKGGHAAPSSMIFVPAAAGLIAAKEAVFDILKNKGVIQ